MCVGGVGVCVWIMSSMQPFRVSVVAKIHCSLQSHF